MSLRRVLKHIVNGVAWIMVTPLGAASGLERRLFPGREGMFRLAAQTLAICPGEPGVYLRRAFYRQAIDACDIESHISFGAILTHRAVVVERGVYVGPWALVGSAWLKEGTSVGSRASLLSGSELHTFADGRWTAYDHRKLRQISLGPHALVGEGAIVMNDVGASALVSTGAVVSTVVPAGVAVAGNPARFVRRLDAERAVGDGA